MEIKTYPVRILGYKKGTKKATGEVYYLVSFACKYDDTFAESQIGEEVATQKVTDDIYAKIAKHKPLDVVKGIITRNNMNLSIYDIVE